MISLRGAREGAVVRALASHQCGPGSNPSVDAICGWSLLSVLSFASRGFSPATPVFPSPQKPAFTNSTSTRNRVDEEPLCGCATSKSLFIYYYLFIYEDSTVYLRCSLCLLRFPGNKGGVGISFSLGPLSLCFVNCHLAARASEARKLRFVFGKRVEYHAAI